MIISILSYYNLHIHAIKTSMVQFSFNRLYKIKLKLN